MDNEDQAVARAGGVTAERLEAHVLPCVECEGEDSMPVYANRTRERHHMSPAKAAVGVALLGSMLLSGASAVVAAAPAGGAVQIFVTPKDDGTGTIVVTGAIGDFGTTLSIDKNGKTNPNGDFEKITLKKGSFEVDSTALNAASDAVRPALNPKTCSAALSVSGPVTFLAGTGLYKGISGTAKITEQGGFVLPTFTSGAKKGQCNSGDSAQPLAQFISISGSGTVKFS